MTHLVEIIDGSLAVPYKRLSDFLYGFRLPDTSYKYLVNFTQDGDSLEVNFKVFSDDGAIAGEGTHDQISIGMRLAANVFHTVYSILKDFLDTTLDPVDYVVFGAKNTESSRVRFYRTLAIQLAKAYNQDPADITEEQDNFRDEDTRQTIFTVPVFVDAANTPASLQEKVDPARTLPFKLVPEVKPDRFADDEAFSYEFVSPDQPEGTFYVVNIHISDRMNLLDINFEINETGVDPENMDEEDRFGLRDVGIRVAMQVFNTVAAILNDALARTELEVIWVTFSAKSSEKSRVKFYHTLAAALAKERGYSADDVRVDEDWGDYVFMIPMA